MNESCKSCGAPLADGQKFCPQCGQPVQTFERAVTENVPVENLKIPVEQAEANSTETAENAEVAENQVHSATSAQTFPDFPESNFPVIPPTDRQFCTNCGVAMGLQADFCVSCGVLKGKVKHFCGDCGAPVSEIQDVCLKCGGRLNRGLNLKSVNFKLPGGTQEQVSQLADSPLGRAFRSFWQRWLDFEGITKRPDYWWAMLAAVLIGAALGLLTLLLSIINLGELGLLLMALYGLALIIPSISSLIRRMRDAGFYWAFIFLGLTGVGFVVLLVFALSPSKN